MKRISMLFCMICVISLVNAKTMKVNVPGHGSVAIRVHDRCGSGSFFIEHTDPFADYDLDKKTATHIIVYWQNKLKPLKRNQSLCFSKKDFRGSNDAINLGINAENPTKSIDVSSIKSGDIFYVYVLPAKNKTPELIMNKLRFKNKKLVSGRKQLREVMDQHPGLFKKK